MTDRAEIAFNNDKIVAVFHPSQPDKSVILMAHGGPGGSKDGPANLFGLLEARLIDCGYGTCRFDFRGAGESSGDFKDVTLCTLKADLLRVVSWCSGRGADRIVYLGESLGATVVLMTVLDMQVPMALLWPAVDLRDTSFRSYMEKPAIDTLVRQGYLNEDGFNISHRFVDECMTLDLWPKIEFLAGSYFIAHGEDDRDVPSTQSDRLAEKLGPRCRYLRLPHAGHGAKSPDAQITLIDSFMEWVQKV